MRNDVKPADVGVIAVFFVVNFSVIVHIEDLTFNMCTLHVANTWTSSSRNREWKRSRTCTASRRRLSWEFVS